MNIITKTNSVSIRGINFPKNECFYFVTKEGTVRVKSKLNLEFELDPSETTIDGVQAQDVNEIVEYLDANLFKAGGTDPGNDGVQSVAGNLVNNNDPTKPVVDFPVGTDKDLAQWDADGNLVVGRIKARQLSNLDGSPVFSFGVLAGSSLQDDNPLMLFTEAGNTPKSGTFPMYATGGVLHVAAGVLDGDAVNLGQFKGSVNNDLTDLETSETMEVLYSDSPIGTTITSTTSSVEYTKYTEGLWKKRSIELI